MSDALPASQGSIDDDGGDHGAYDDHHAGLDRYAVFMPVVQKLVNALGGTESVETAPGVVETVYRPGDSVLGVLKDLKKLWRKDDEDDERTVARCMARAGLMRELIALVGECTERGEWGQKVALLACDLIAALTWPIDVAQELKEMEDDRGVVTDYASLLRAQVEYKSMILHSDTLRCLLALLLPFLAKKQREEKEDRIVSLGLHIIRNLLAIKDVVADGSAIGEKAELSTLQLDKLTFLQLLLTMASAADRIAFNPFNMLILDILHLIFRSVRVRDLGQDQARLLDSEKRQKGLARTANTRHSRFGTTIAVQAGPQRIILHSQKAITSDPGKILDASKKKRVTRVKRVDDGMLTADLSPEAIIALQRFTRTFIDSCFNVFIASVLKDIRMERSKVRPKDSVRALFIARYCIEYLLLLRGKVKRGKPVPEDLALGLVAEMAEVDSLRWVVARMRMAMEEKPIAWTELQTSLDCFTQILLLLGAMSASPDAEDVEVAEILQNQLYYNGDVLDSCLAVVTNYKDQSMNSVVNFAYVLLRMLEKYSKNKAFMFVRKRRAARKKRQAVATGAAPPEPTMPEEYGNDDDEEDVHQPDRDAPSFAEHAFTFESFERRFAQETVVNTLLAYLHQYREFSEPEQMKRVVGLMHRQIVRAKAEGLYFKVTCLHLFKQILDDQANLPKHESTTNLVQLIRYVLKKFFKRAATDPFLIVEALLPKGRGQWKEYSEYRSGDEGAEDGMAGQRGRIKEKLGPGELEFKKNKNVPWSQQMGIVVSMLVKAGHEDWIRWIIQVLEVIHATRQEVVLAIDGEEDLRGVDSDGERVARDLSGPSKAAIEKFTAHDLAGETESQAAAVSSDPHLRLMLKLLSFELADVADAVAQRWTLPTTVAPAQLQMYLGALAQFLAAPPDVEGAADLLRKSRKPRRRAVAAPSDTDGEGGVRERVPSNRKAAETQTFKSAAFIDDSDDDEAADAAFFAREAELRKEMEALAARGATTMLTTGTKRKRGPGKGEKGKGKKQGGSEIDSDTDVAGPATAGEADDEDVEVDEDSDKGAVRARRGLARSSERQGSVEAGHSDMDGGGQQDSGSEADSEEPTQSRPRRRVAVESDDD